MLKYNHIAAKYLSKIRSGMMSEYDFLRHVNLIFEYEFESLDELFQFEEIMEHPRFISKRKGGKQVFSMIADFDVIYHDFKVAGICDLLKEDIDWLAFNFHISSFLNSQSSAIALRVQERQSANENNKTTQFKISRSLEY